MIDTTVQLICDGCEISYPAAPADMISTVRIRLAAQKAGWVTIGRGRSLRDVCPICIPRVRP